METDIFTKAVNKKYNLSGKLTTTNVLETVPKNCLDKPTDEDWRKLKQTEWRWRFLTVKNRSTVEISYLTHDSDKRVYFNSSGEWVNRDVDPIYDQFVTKSSYYYSND